MSRFDYVKYDEKAALLQSEFKQIFERLAIKVEAQLEAGRAKSLVQTKLEEAYMWVGKAIRDDQISRGAPAPLQEERTNA